MLLLLTPMPPLLIPMPPPLTPMLPRLMARSLLAPRFHCQSLPAIAMPLSLLIATCMSLGEMPRVTCSRSLQ